MKREVGATRKTAVHAALAGGRGELLIGGQSVPRLAERAGATPFYAYDRMSIQTRVSELRAVLPPSIQIRYAMKANPMPAVVGMMVGLADGIDVASGGELLVALDAGANPAQVSFAGPGKRDRELRQAVAAGVLVNVESERELPVLAQASQDLGLPARVALRVNPDFELKGAGMKMGGGPKQFGLDAEVLPAILRRVSELGLAFEGFQLFAGSQNLRAESICEAQQKSYDLALRLAADAPAPVRFLNLGGGFGIPYFPGETALDVAAVSASLGQIAEHAKTALPQASIVIELGRYLVGEAGFYVARIIDRKVSRGQVFLVTDGGLNHNLSASGNFGQVIRRNYPVDIVTRSGNPAREVATVVGPLCTPLDLLADKMELPVAEVGDLVVVFQSGAYGRSASPQDFLGHPHCTEVLV